MGVLRHLHSEEHMKPTAAAQTGMKQQQFEALFAKYHRLVYCGAYSVTGNNRDAEDALQSLFLKLIDLAPRRSGSCHLKIRMFVNYANE